MPLLPYAQPVDAVAAELGVDPRRGLSDREAAGRRAAVGPNELNARGPVPEITLLARQLISPVVALLVAAMVASAAFDQWHQAVAVGVVLVINTAIGYLTERRAVRSMEALRALGGRSARVRRDGASRSVAAADLVPGDVVLLEAGDVVPADLRCLAAAALGVDESTLTGESVPVGKDVAANPESAPLPERAAMLFTGTHVVRGSGEGLVVATGLATELGRVSELVETADAGESPLEGQLARLSRQLIWVTLLLAGAVAAAGALTGLPARLMIETAIALAVAAIPEGLPIVATLALARGMLRMAREHALVERLAAVETLGSTTVVLTDKTGTLTENRMEVERVVTPAGTVVLDYRRVDAGVDPELRRALLVGVLCGNAEFDSGSSGFDAGTGDPMEVALVRAGGVAGLRRAEQLARFPEIAEHPFDPATKWMATVHRDGDGWFTALKGAPETVLGLIEGLDPDERARWLVSAESLAAEGLRVLALASGPCRDPASPLSGELEFLGLAALRDPPRPDIAEAVGALGRAGIHVAMATGDHPATARAIARTVGIDDARVFARVSPADKLALIEGFQRDGEVVAMIGDGVNDAPALVKADIGVAMGRRGTEVAREAADMVLLDDRFPTIVTAAREGRVIFDNIRRFSTYLLSCNLAEVLVVALAIVVGLPLPLLPLQILFLNLVTDVFPAFALANGEAEGDVMDRPPRPPGEPIITAAHWRMMALYAMAIAASTLAAQSLALHWLGLGPAAANTVSFLTIALAQLWHVFTMRSPGTSALRNAVTGNRLVWYALALCLVLITAAVLIPAVASALGIGAIGAPGWGLAFAASLVPLLVGQLWLAWRGGRAGAVRMISPLALTFVLGLSGCGAAWADATPPDRPSRPDASRAHGAAELGVVLRAPPGARRHRSPAARPAQPAPTVARAHSSELQVEPELDWQGGILRGTLGATSARNLTFTLVSPPSLGGKLGSDTITNRVLFGPQGQFSYLPAAGALVDPGRLESFSVLVAEETPFDRFLTGIPLLGLLAGQVLQFLHRAPGLGEVLAPLIGAAQTVTFTSDPHALAAGRPTAFTHLLTSFDGTAISVNYFPALDVATAEVDSAPTVLLGPGLPGAGDTDVDNPVDQLLSAANRFGGSLAPGIPALRSDSWVSPDGGPSYDGGGGYNVITWDPRGEYASGGVLQLDNPFYEGRDVSAIISWAISAANPARSQVRVDDSGDPLVGMTGGSYGGGIQLTTAATDPRIDAIVPQLAWNSLLSSLYPYGTQFKTAVGAGLGIALAITGARVNTQIYDGIATGLAIGLLSETSQAVLSSSGPTSLLSRLRAPTLLFQGMEDVLFTLEQSVTNAEAILANPYGVPVKMVWFCGGHGTCLDPLNPDQDDRGLVDNLKWLDQYLAGDPGRPADTIPVFQWYDQRGVHWSSDLLPFQDGFNSPDPFRVSGPGGVLGIAGVLGGSGPYPLDRLPYAIVNGGPAANALRLAVVPPVGSQIVGAPRLSFSYAGLGTARTVYAQLVDDTTGRVLGNIVTPIPVTLDGRERTVSIPMEQIAYTAGAGDSLTLEITSAASNYANFVSLGLLDISGVQLEMHTRA